MRRPAIATAVSTALITAWLSYEGYSAKPYVPTQGDRPTIGHGSTFYSDGTPVKLTDPPITRQQAYTLAVGELERKYGDCVRKSLGSTLVEQIEFDKAVDFAGQYGCGAWNSSSMLKLTLVGEYPRACKAYLEYRFMKSSRKEGPGWEPYKFDQKGRPTAYRFDCSTPGNKVCRGVWSRQLDRYNGCMSVQR